MGVLAVSSFANDLVAVLVLYRMNLAQSRAFISLTESLRCLDTVAELLIYDNSPEMSHSAEGSSVLPWCIHYMHDPLNSGVSRAYNEGAWLGRQYGKRWVLLLDQDTWFPPNALEAYARAVAEYPEIALFAPRLVTSKGTLLSPCTYRFRRGFVISRPDQVRAGRQPLANRSLLNSGLLINIEAYEQIGGYNARIRLDFADFDFIERYKRLFKDYVLVDVKCLQSFSGESTDLTGSLRRFAFYCEGARQSISTILDIPVLSLVTLARCVKLTIQFRTVRFLDIYVRHFIAGQAP